MASGAEFGIKPPEKLGTYAARPAGTFAGQRYFATDSLTSYIYDGSAWRIAGGVMTPADVNSWGQIGSYATAIAPNGAAAFGINSFRAHPIRVPFQVTIDQFAIECTVTGDVAAFARCGIYTNDVSQGYDRPGTLFAGLGDSPALSAVQVFTQAVTGGTIVIPPGVYWLAANTQFSGANPTLRTVINGDNGGPTRSVANVSMGVGAAGTVAAYSPLPNTFPNITGSNAAMRIALRRSA